MRKHAEERAEASGDAWRRDLALARPEDGRRKGSLVRPQGLVAFYRTRHRVEVEMLRCGFRGPRHVRVDLETSRERQEVADRERGARVVVLGRDYLDIPAGHRESWILGAQRIRVAEIRTDLGPRETAHARGDAHARALGCGAV
jgi:hypothetical protein